MISRLIGLLVAVLLAVVAALFAEQQPWIGHGLPSVTARELVAGAAEDSPSAAAGTLAQPRTKPWRHYRARIVTGHLPLLAQLPRSIAVVAPQQLHGFNMAICKLGTKFVCAVRLFNTVEALVGERVIPGNRKSSAREVVSPGENFIWGLWKHKGTVDATVFFECEFDAAALDIRPTGPFQVLKADAFLPPSVGCPFALSDCRLFAAEGKLYMHDGFISVIKDIDLSAPILQRLTYTNTNVCLGPPADTPKKKTGGGPETLAAPDNIGDWEAALGGCCEERGRGGGADKDERPSERERSSERSQATTHRKQFDKNWSLLRVTDREFLFVHWFEADGLYTVTVPKNYTYECKKRRLVAFGRDPIPPLGSATLPMFSLGTPFVCVDEAKQLFVAVGHLKIMTMHAYDPASRVAQFRDELDQLARRLPNFVQHASYHYLGYFILIGLADPAAPTVHISDGFLPIRPPPAPPRPPAQTDTAPPTSTQYQFSIFFPVGCMVSGENLVISGGLGDYYNVLLERPLASVISSCTHDVQAFDQSAYSFCLLERPDCWV